MKLAELPSILVERVEEDVDGTTVHGRFDRLERVREQGCFRLKRGEYAWADLTIVDRTACSVLATVTYLYDYEIRMRGGERYTWLDRYWQLPFVEAVADGRTEWRKFTFQATDAQYFRQGDAIGWQQVGGRLPDGAVELGVKSGGWDHEHCDLCGAHIDAESSIGYADPEGHFLCSKCYDRYGANHDVSFQLGA
jgi:hypothetical protein